MIRRPLNERFSEAVLGGVKTTTIRDNPWPVGKPIMLFRWEGKPYRSKQVEIAAVVVESVNSIVIGRTDEGDGMFYIEHPCHVSPRLWESEGFPSREEMDAWFRPFLLPGQTLTKHLMRFRMLEGGAA